MKKALIISGIVFWLVTSVGLLHAQYGHSNIYDRIGIITEHGRFGAVPEENIDLFTGNLTLRFLDIHLPGPNGLDLKIWRVYNPLGHSARAVFLGGNGVVHAYGPGSQL